MEFFTYLIKVNIAIAVLYGSYGLLFRSDTFFRWKRVLLLSIPAIALLYPLVDVLRLLSYEVASGSSLLPSYYLNEVTVTANGGQPGDGFSLASCLPALIAGAYLLGVTVALVRMASQVASVCSLLLQAQKMKVDGQTVYRKKGLQTPFSFFRYIVLDPQQYPACELQEIIRHEATHVRQRHSLDVMAAEIMTAFCWFNPFVRLMKREIRMNLEYLADRSVINAGLGREHYQLHLLRLTYHKAIATITNNFNVSPLKKRISMMNKNETPRLGLAKYLLVLPVIAALLIFNSFNQNPKSTAASEKNATDIKIRRTGALIIIDDVVSTYDDLERLQPDSIASVAVLKDSSATALYGARGAKGVILVETKKKAAAKKVFTAVEEMPQFPGGETALMKWLQNSIKYPKTAFEQGIQGRAVVSFIIRADGSIDDIRTVQPLSTDCDSEAIRVVKAMPKWIPGKQDGKQVDVYYTLPIVFKLE
ncbi:MAG: TonB family protein [Prevotellaceae bacterium]|jgi:TonB family protein|nr:TonB family protein [Prevotellaceae bacterium]